MNSVTENSTTLATQMRPKLLAVAYRMLGSAADAEDIVQDAYVRYQQTPDIAAPDAWLVKTTTRLCIDRLRQAKRRADYHGPWLPEPISNEWDGAGGDRLEMAESLSTAFLVLLETLSPAERATYLLREVFGYEFEEIARLLDKTSVNVRQIATRAKRRIQDKERRFHPTSEEVNELADRFFKACCAGDMPAIESILAPDVILYSDGGGKRHAAPKPVRGVSRITKLMSVLFRKLQQAGRLELTTVNGQPGAVFFDGDSVAEIFTFSAADGVIRELYAVVNPDKLRTWNTQNRNSAGQSQSTF